MTILLTGSAGFIAGYVKKENKRLGMDMVFLDKAIYDDYYYRIDLSKDVEKLEKLFKEEDIQYVIHLAGQTSVFKSQSNPVEDITDNIIATANLLKVCKKHNVEKFVYASTAAVYGNLNNPDENSPTLPLSNYGTDKLTCENYIRNSGIPYLIYRFSNVYGKGGSGVISILLDCVKNSLPFHMNGDGKQVRDFVYVEDIAKMLISGLINPNYKDVTVNLSTGIGTQLTELINKVEELSGKKIKIIKEPENSAEIKTSILKNDLLQSKGGSEFITLNEGIQQMLTNEAHDDNK